MMGGSANGSGGGGRGASPPAPPPQYSCSSSSSSVMRGGGGGAFPSCDSEEFSALFNQLLSPQMVMDPNNSHSGSGHQPNRVIPLSVSSSTFHFSSHHDIDDPFDHHHHNHHHHHHNHNNAYIPLSDGNTKQQLPITCPIQKNGEDSELPSKPVPPSRTSSKRSRAAEFHNLSEKRRRSRINEKMKALQNLIPNSNKTDKASMLDEAIEYLKQLQLQVQMLMMRNGLSLHPMSLPGGLRPMVLPHTGLNFDEGNGFQNSISGIASSANDESLAQPSFSFAKQCSISNQSFAITSVTDIAASDTSSGFQPPIKDAHCSSVPQLHLDTTRIGKTPSPDVS